MLEVQHLQFLCIVFEFQLIGQIGYWQLKPTRTSKSKLKKWFPENRFQNTDMNLTLLFSFDLRWFFRSLSLFIFRSRQSENISFVTQSFQKSRKSREKIEKNADQKIQRNESKNF